MSQMVLEGFGRKLLCYIIVLPSNNILSPLFWAMLYGGALL